MDQVTLAPMTIEDYPEVRELWLSIKGFAIRSIDDSREGVERFLARNPATSVTARVDGRLVGAILCGHDGRRGCLYHVCVHADFRRHGIGRAMVRYCVEALQAEHISQIALIAFSSNSAGNAFWKEIGWLRRADQNNYELTINTENTIKVNE